MKDEKVKEDWEGLATSLACNAGVLFGRVNAKKLAIIY